MAQSEDRLSQRAQLPEQPWAAGVLAASPSRLPGQCPPQAVPKGVPGAVSAALRPVWGVGGKRRARLEVAATL